KLETLSFSLPQQAWICPFTHRLIDTTFRGLTPYLPRKVDNRDYRCRLVTLPDLTGVKVAGTGQHYLNEIRQILAKDTTVAALRAEN
ncbi:MAG: hypothetical protein NWQ54_09895, partial [Paraglaciecola sp.]|nr:hypothetical protein [Paraglaciecola sp.]